MYIDVQVKPARRSRTIVKAQTAMSHDARTDSLLPFPEVQAATGLSRSTIYEKISQGAFPPPIKIGRASRWSMIELQAWMESLRMAQARRRPAA